MSGNLRDVSINISVKFTQPRLDSNGQPLPSIALDEGDLEPNINISLDIPQDDTARTRSITPTRFLRAGDYEDDNLDFPAALLRSGGDMSARPLQYNRHSFKSKDFKAETAPSSSKRIRAGSARRDSTQTISNDDAVSGTSSEKADADGYSDGSLTPVPDSPPLRKKGKTRISHVKPISGKKAQAAAVQREHMPQSSSRSDGQSRIGHNTKSTTGSVFPGTGFITPAQFEDIYRQRAEAMRLESIEQARRLEEERMARGHPKYIPATKYLGAGRLLENVGNISQYNERFGSSQGMIDRPSSAPSSHPQPIAGDVPVWRSQFPQAQAEQPQSTASTSKVMDTSANTPSAVSNVSTPHISQSSRPAAPNTSHAPTSNQSVAPCERITLRLPNPALTKQQKQKKSQDPPAPLSSRASYPPPAGLKGLLSAGGSQQPTSADDRRSLEPASQPFRMKNMTPELFETAQQRKRKRTTEEDSIKEAIDRGMNVNELHPRSSQQDFAHEHRRASQENPLEDQTACGLSEVAEEAKALSIFEPIYKPSLEEVSRQSDRPRPAPSPKHENGFSLPSHNVPPTMPPRYDEKFSADFDHQLRRRIVNMNLPRWYPHFVPVARNPVTRPDLAIFFDNMSVAGLFKNCMAVPIYKGFYGDGYLIEKTIRRRVLVVLTDHNMVIMDHTAGLAKILRIVPFYLVTDLKMNDSPLDLPVISFKIDPRDELSRYMNTPKLSLDPENDRITFFVDNTDGNFHPAALRYWSFKMARVAQLKKRPFETYSVKDAMTLFGRFKSSDLRFAIQHITSPVNRELFAGVTYNTMTQQLDLPNAPSAPAPSEQPIPVDKPQPQRQESAHPTPPTMIPHSEAAGNFNGTT